MKPDDNERNADGIARGLQRQLDHERDERDARRRRHTDAARADGTYTRRYGSYAAGTCGPATPPVDEKTRQARKAARDALRARNKARGLPQDTPECPPRLHHSNRTDRKEHDHEHPETLRPVRTPVAAHQLQPTKRPKGPKVMNTDEEKLSMIIADSVAALPEGERQRRIMYCQVTGRHGCTIRFGDGDDIEVWWAGSLLAAIDRSVFTADGRPNLAGMFDPSEVPDTPEGLDG